MSPLYLYNGKLLINNNQLASNQNCCCEPCECAPLNCTVNFTVDGNEFTWNIENGEGVVSSERFYLGDSFYCDEASYRSYAIQGCAYCENGIWRIGIGFYMGSILDGDCYYWDPDFGDSGGYRNVYYHKIKVYTIEVSACDCSNVTDLGSQVFEMFLDYGMFFENNVTCPAMRGEWASNSACGPICGDYEGSPDECPEAPVIRFPVRPWDPACDPADREITVAVECCGGVCCQTSCGCTSNVTVTGLGAWGFNDPWEAGGFGAADYQSTESYCPNLQGQNRCWNDTWEWSPNHLINDNYALIASGSAGQSSEPCDSALTFAGFSVSVYTRSDYDNGNLSNPVAYAHFEGSPEAIVPLPHTLSLSRDVCDSCGDINIVAEITETECAEGNRCLDGSTQEECEANGGTWHQGSTCEDNPCNLPCDCVNCTSGQIEYDIDGTLLNIPITTENNWSPYTLLCNDDNPPSGLSYNQRGTTAYAFCQPNGKVKVVIDHNWVAQGYCAQSKTFEYEFEQCDSNGCPTGTPTLINTTDTGEIDDSLAFCSDPAVNRSCQNLSAPNSVTFNPLP